MGRCRSERQDGAEPDPRTLWRLERRAVLDGRPAKEPVTDAEVLRAEWRRRAAAVGVEALEVPTSPALPGTAPLDPEAVIANAPARVAADSATWLVGHLAREIATLVPARAAASATELVELAAQAPGAAWSCTPRRRPAWPAGHPTTAVHWVRTAGGDWNAYAAHLIRDRDRER